MNRVASHKLIDDVPEFKCVRMSAFTCARVRRMVCLYGECGDQIGGLRRQIVRYFLTDEIMKAQIPGSDLRSTHAAEVERQTIVFTADNAEVCEQRWKDIHTRVVEHVRPQSPLAPPWHIAGV